MRALAGNHAVLGPARALMCMAIVASLLASSSAQAAVVNEQHILDGRLRWNTGGASRSLVAAESVEAGDTEIVAWDRSREEAVAITANDLEDSNAIVAGDLIAWRQFDQSDTSPTRPTFVLAYNARSGVAKTLGQAALAGDLASDGRYVVYETGSTVKCWDSFTGATRTVPTVGGVWQAHMSDGVLVWIDDVHDVAEGTDPATGFVRAWDAGSGVLRTLSGPVPARDTQTDGRLVAWVQQGSAWLWDPALGTARRVFATKDIALDRGVLVGFTESGFAVRDASGTVRKGAPGPFPAQADYSDGLLGGVFYDQQFSASLRTIDVNTQITDELASDVSTMSDVWVADDLVVDTVGSARIDAAQIARPVRLEGRTRYDVSFATAQAAFPRWEGVKDVVIACGDDRAAADPLAAAGLCWRYDAPLLLVGSRQAPASVVAAVKEIVGVNGPITVHVVGGRTSVPDAVVARITAAAGTGNATVDRIAGSDRYTLAAAIAGRVRAGHPNGTLPAALIANGADSTKFFDAAALSAIAAAKGYPILLTSRDAVPASTRSFLQTADPDIRIVAGGRASVSDVVVRRLGAERWSGADRYSTAAVIATKATDPQRDWLDPSACGIANKLPDALSGGAVTGHAGGPLLLVRDRTLPSSTKAFLEANRSDIETCWVLGGADSVWSSVLSRASQAAFDPLGVLHPAE